MKADPKTIRTLFRYELRVLLRDRRTVIFSILLPLAILPLVFFLSHKMEQSREAKLQVMTYRYAVSGPEAEYARGLIAEGLAAAAAEGNAPKLEEVAVDSPWVALKEGDLHFHLATLAPDQPDGLPVLRLDFRGDNDASTRGERKISDLLNQARRQRKEAQLREYGFPVEPEAVAAVNVEDVASAEQVSGAILGVILTPLLVFLMMTGGAVVAADTIAGEKERGTLETLLTTAATRFEVVTAKQLLILAVAVVITVVQVVNIMVYIGLGVMDVSQDFSVSLSPTSAILLLLLFLPLAAFLSSLLLLLSGHAKSYKEFQITYLPVFLLGLLPAFAAVLPGVTLRSAVALVPLANISVAVKEVMVGRYDWLMLLTTWLITLAIAVYTTQLASRALSKERLITASELDVADLAGGPALFPRHVLRWFGVLWVLIFLGSVYAGESASLQRQLVFNLIVVMLGGSLLMIWKYRLDPREALALRPVRPAVWLAVLVGAPAAYVVGAGVFELVNLVFPVPEHVLEAFGRELLPEGMPLWELLLFLAILPGICEELTFRGVLLYGLHRRFRPLALCAVVGVVFGLFHVSLFRLAPTTYIGLVLAGVTLLTGSIFPAMLWHALHNALPVLAHRMGYSDIQFGQWHFALAAVVTGLTFWVLWLNRMPYPGLRRAGRASGPPQRAGAG